MIGGVISRFQTGTYTVTRTTAAAPVAGRYVAGSSSTISVDASIQPVSGRDLKILPEARHGEDVRVVYTLTALKTVSPGYDADSIAIGGEAYEVFKVEAWPNHYRVFVSRQVKP